MKEIAGFSAELNPFERAPAHSSRIEGLGGRRTGPDPSYAFSTTDLMVPGGLVTFTLVFERLRATRGTLLIEILDGLGADRKQVTTRTLSLAQLAAEGGRHEISLLRGDRGFYALAGHIYDVTDAVADELTISVSVSSASKVARRTVAGDHMVRAGRLASLQPPRFLHPASQTWTPSQMREEAFSSACRTLDLPAGAESWAAASVYQGLISQLGGVNGLRGFGAGASVDPLARTLTSQGAEIVSTSEIDPGVWPAASSADFAWLIVQEPAEPRFSLFVRSCSLLERLKPGGSAVIIFPFVHGPMQHEPSLVLKRGDVEILALTLLAQGHNVAELKFRSNRPLRPGQRTPFSLLLRRGPS